MSNNNDIWAQRAAKQENLIQSLHHQNQSLMARQQNAANHHGEMLEQLAFRAMDAKRRDREESQQPTSTAPPKDEVGGSTLNISSFINGHPLNPARVVIDVDEEEDDDTDESSTQIQGDESSSEDEEEEEDAEDEEEEYEIIIRKYPHDPNTPPLSEDKKRHLAFYAEMAHDIILERFGLGDLVNREPMVNLRSQIYNQLHRLNSEMAASNVLHRRDVLYTAYVLSHLGEVHRGGESRVESPMRADVLEPMEERFGDHEFKQSMSFMIWLCLNILNDTIIKLCRLYNISVVIPE